MVCDKSEKLSEDQEITDVVEVMTPEELAALDLADETLHVKDEQLVDLGKEIKEIEEELVARIAEDDRDWEELQKPMYAHQIEQLQQKIKVIEDQIQSMQIFQASKTMVQVWLMILLQMK